MRPLRSQLSPCAARPRLPVGGRVRTTWRRNAVPKGIAWRTVPAPLSRSPGIDLQSVGMRASRASKRVLFHAHDAEGWIIAHSSHLHVGAAERARGRCLVPWCLQTFFQSGKSPFQFFHPFRQLADLLPDRDFLEDLQNVRD